MMVSCSRQQVELSDGAEELSRSVGLGLGFPIEQNNKRERKKMLYYCSDILIKILIITNDKLVRYMYQYVSVCMYIYMYCYGFVVS